MKLDIDLLPAQKDFLDDVSPFPAIVGGLGSGKTEGGINKVLISMLRNPGANFAYYMPTFDLLTLRAIPGFVETLTQWGLPFKYNGSSNIIDVKGFGEIIFRSMSRPERIIAYETFGSIVDELDTLNKDKAEHVWRKIVERNRQVVSKSIDENFIGCVTTPDFGIHGFVYHKWGHNPKPGYSLTKAATVDNVFLPSGYVEQIRSNYDPVLAELYLRGEFVNLTTNTVFSYFDRERHHRDIEDDGVSTVHIGMDFNVGGCCMAIFKIENGVPKFYNEAAPIDTMSAIQWIFKHYSNRTVVIYPDATGRSGSTNATMSNIELLEEAGFIVDAPRANPRVMDRITSVNVKFSKDEIFIDVNKCPKTVVALEQQAYDANGSPEKFSGAATIDDRTDALSYPIHRKFGLIRPTISAFNKKFN